VPVLREERRERHLDTRVPGRTHILQDAGVPARRWELAVHEQVARVGVIVDDQYPPSRVRLRPAAALRSRHGWSATVALGTSHQPPVRRGKPGASANAA